MLYPQCGYIGLCYNGHHNVWVSRLIQQCFLALVSYGKTQVDADIAKQVKQYFQRAVTAARQWLPSHEARVLMVSGKDDSGMEE